MGISVSTGHVIIVVVAILCGLITLKVTKKVFGAVLLAGVVAVLTKYFGLW